MPLPRFTVRCATVPLLCASLLMGGCASVLNGRDQDVKVETFERDGSPVQDAQCSLSNDKGTSHVRPGANAVVRRSGANLDIRCTAAGHAPAMGQAISRVNAAMFGNILLGGAIGMVIDAATGAAFTYPVWGQLVFGEERSFDRNGNRLDDRPAKGDFVRAVAAPATPAARRNAATVAPSASTDPAAPGAPPPQPTPADDGLAATRATGRDTYTVEKLASAQSCAATPRAILQHRAPGLEVHTVTCDNGRVQSFRCEFGNCQPQP